MSKGEAIRIEALQEAERAILAAAFEFDLPAEHYAGAVHDLYEPGLACGCCCSKCLDREPQWKTRERAGKV